MVKPKATMEDQSAGFEKLNMHSTTEPQECNLILGGAPSKKFLHDEGQVS
jgi:hypothetical protein